MAKRIGLLCQKFTPQHTITLWAITQPSPVIQPYPGLPQWLCQPNPLSFSHGWVSGWGSKFQRHFYLMTGCGMLRLIKTWALPSIFLSHRLFFTLSDFYICTNLMAIYSALKPGLLHSPLQPCSSAMSVYLGNVQYLASTSYSPSGSYICLLTDFFHAHISI